MDTESVAIYISSWIRDYTQKAGKSGLVIGISGGIDSSVTSTLCGMTGLRTTTLSLPISQDKAQLKCAELQHDFLKSRFPNNIKTQTIDLTDCFDKFAETLGQRNEKNTLALANSKARLRMMTLYHIAGLEDSLVVGTGNKIEDFGVGFFTKYGDGGVDISPIADLYKSEVFLLGKHLSIPQEIQQAEPTDGLWEDGRTDEDQLKCSYKKLEAAMKYKNGECDLDEKEETKSIDIYESLHTKALHKIDPIPVCRIPIKIKSK